MKELNAYIWDLDGTLIDSYGSIVSSLMELIGQTGINDSYEDVLKAVKQGSVSSYLRDLSVRCGEEYESLRRQYQHFSHKRLDEITLIPGAEETLRALLPAQHFVYTHRGNTTEALMTRLGLTEFFREIVTFERGFKPKPSGEGAEYLVRQYGLSKERTAYVGDRPLDIYCARDAGIKAILYLPEDSCVIPTGLEDRIIRRLEDLQP